MKMSLIESIIDSILTDFTNRERRNFVYLFNDFIRYVKNNIYVGSFAEGLVNNGDIDMMVLLDSFIVIDSIDDMTDDIDEALGILIVDTEDCHPGFARLLVHKEPAYKPFQQQLSCLYNGRKYFDGKKLIDHFAVSAPSQKPNEILKHGPAVLMARSFTDVTLCFFYYRSKKFNVKEQLYFVSKCHEDSKNPDIEFRWSFSVIEYNKIREFTDKEFQLYFIGKELYNTYLKSNDEKKTCISSYTVKTVILYFTDKHKEEIESKPIINLVRLFLCDMKLSLQERYLPNYFNRDCNMFDVLKDEDAQEAIANIENIEKDLVLAILKCNFLSDTINSNCLVTLCSIYEVVTTIGDYNAKEDILTNIIIEKSFQNNYQNKSIREFCDLNLYILCLQHFQTAFVSGMSYFDVLCIYFHFNSIFKDSYSASVTERFQYLFTRFLSLYLLGIAPKNNHVSIIHLLIQTVMYRLKYQPNPSIVFNTTMPLAFYYYLCSKKRKALELLYESTIDTTIDIFGDNIYIRVTGCPSSIVTNDIILAKYFENYSISGKIDYQYLYVTPIFLMYYIIARITCGTSKHAIKMLEENGEWDGNALYILQILKDNL